MFHKGRQDNQSIAAGGKDLILSCGSKILLLNVNFEKRANILDVESGEIAGCWFILTWLLADYLQ